MSLDVYLIDKEEYSCDCPDCKTLHLRDVEVYSTNITHNLGQMAEAAGIYKALWRPGEIDKSTAGDIIDILEKGLTDLQSRPEYFKQFNASNGWGMYEHFVPFVEGYLMACKNNPKARIRVSR